MAEINWEELEREVEEFRSLVEDLEYDIRTMIRGIRRKNLEMFTEGLSEASIAVDDLRAMIDKLYRKAPSSDPLLKLLMRRK